MPEFPGEFLGFSLEQLMLPKLSLTLDVGLILIHTTGLVIEDRWFLRELEIKGKGRKTNKIFVSKQMCSKEGTCVEIRITVHFKSRSQPLTWQDHPKRGDAAYEGRCGLITSWRRLGTGTDGGGMFFCASHSSLECLARNGANDQESE